MVLTETIGFLAAILTTAAFVPQALKTIKTKETEGLSLPTFLMICIGTLLWFIYGFISMDYPLILANSITCILSGIISFMIIFSDKTS